ncbi:GFA family protein [Parvularcula marina]|uniref:GFA family protein n=1 Tax=Parvularcula marina TaxID=2292771 RepID=UPI0035152185
MTGPSAKTGGCHCGAVAWEADLPAKITAQSCNCTMCEKVGFIHVIVPRSRFRLLTDPAAITTYEFNTKIAKHTFCSVCGVKSFYTPRSNPDGVSLNLRCMDKSQFDEITIEPFDGQNWEENAGALRHLSEE